MSAILTVCDANICRSVAAELLLAEGLADVPGIEVSSAGVNALQGHHACSSVLNLRQTAAWRLEAQARRSRQLDAPMVEHADLVLTATRESRSTVVSLAPAARRRVFTLREALWLAEGYRLVPRQAGADALGDFVAHLDRSRGLRPTAEPKRGLLRRHPQHPFDISDGHLRGHRAHATTLREVQDAVAGLLALMRPGDQLDSHSTASISLQ